jgi:hypothetical protein
VRSSRANRCTACAFTLAAAIAGAADVSAHRRDEYLQAARVGIEPGAVHLELSLTPGIELAEAVIGDIDRNNDGSLSMDEQRAYAALVVSALTFEVDASPVAAQLAGSAFPEPDAMRRGEGTIRMQLSGTLPRLSAGVHRLRFGNRHQPARSVYLANALVPQSPRVSVMAQRRDELQRELIVEYVLRSPPPKAVTAGLLGGLAAAVVLSGLLLRRPRVKKA